MVLTLLYIYIGMAIITSFGYLVIKRNEPFMPNATGEDSWFGNSGEWTEQEKAISRFVVACICGLIWPVIGIILILYVFFRCLGQIILRFVQGIDYLANMNWGK